MSFPRHFVFEKFTKNDLLMCDKLHYHYEILCQNGPNMFVVAFNCTDDYMNEILINIGHTPINGKRAKEMSLDNQILIHSRDIHGNRYIFKYDTRDDFITGYSKDFSEEDQILFVKWGSNVIYNALVNDIITMEDLVGFFA